MGVEGLTPIAGPFYYIFPGAGLENEIDGVTTDWLRKTGRPEEEVKMNLHEKTAPAAKSKAQWILLVAYIPLCCLATGLIAFYMRLKALGSGSVAFKDVFWSYAVPRPGTLSGIHIPALAIGLIILFLLVSLSYWSKPVLTLFQVRIILLVLIALFTILAKIMLTTAPFLVETGALKPSLFLLFADIDIVVVFLATFLPMFRRLKTRLV